MSNTIANAAYGLLEGVYAMTHILGHGTHTQPQPEPLLPTENPSTSKSEKERTSALPKLIQQNIQLVVLNENYDKESIPKQPEELEFRLRQNPGLDRS